MRRRKSAGVGKTLKEQKHSWCSELPSFFIFLWCTPSSSHSQHAIIISKIKSFYTVFRPSSGTFPFHLFSFLSANAQMFLPAFRLSLPCCKYTKSTINFTKIAKGFLCEKERERERKKYAAELSSTSSRLCVNTLRTVPCALSLGKFTSLITETFSLKFNDKVSVTQP